MAAGMYLEHYLDSIENLPFELQRNFQLMRDLDQRTEEVLDIISGPALWQLLSKFGCPEKFPWTLRLLPVGQVGLIRVDSALSGPFSPSSVEDYIIGTVFSLLYSPAQRNNK
uniref:Inhibitor of growth family member 4 n=1 Tax=Monodelphis domestica TaxID=13616 RepID=A0A5F8G2B3_MONDO